MFVRSCLCVCSRFSSPGTVWAELKNKERLSEWKRKRTTQNSTKFLRFQNHLDCLFDFEKKRFVYQCSRFNWFKRSHSNSTESRQAIEWNSHHNNDRLKFKHSGLRSSAPAVTISRFVSKLRELSTNRQLESTNHHQFKRERERVAWSNDRRSNVNYSVFCRSKTPTLGRCAIVLCVL